MRHVIRVLCMAGFVGFLSGCGVLTSTSNKSESSPTRRLYVNDPATNDSLITALARTSGNGAGLLFVLQPNKSYHLRLATTSAGDQLSLFASVNNGTVSLGLLNPAVSANSDTEIFTIQSTQTYATLFAGLLQSPDGFNARKRISRVNLISVSTTQSYAINVNLIMVGKLSNAGLPDSASKANFAKAFLAELGSIYQSNSSGFSPAITFTGTYSIAAPDSAVVVMNFGPTFVPLSGKRVANAANLYLVDSISFSGITAGEEVLGFSPREVTDLSTDGDSRVILSARGAFAAGGSTITAGIPSLATTTAHEMGHFFGLRHPTATDVDLSNDDDASNRDDGFASTPLCSVLSKKTSERITSTSYNGKSYCLYVAVHGCPTTCDYTNLMFAYSCTGNDPKGQRLLTSEQQVFFRKNLALLQGK